MTVTELQGIKVSDAYNDGGRAVSTAMVAVWIRDVLTRRHDATIAEADDQLFQWRDEGYVEAAIQIRHYRLRRMMVRSWLNDSPDDDNTAEQQLFAAHDLRLAAIPEDASIAVATALSWIASVVARPAAAHAVRTYLIGMPTNTVALAVAPGGVAYLFNPDTGVYRYDSVTDLAEDAADFIFESSQWFSIRTAHAYSYIVSLDQPAQTANIPAPEATRGGLSRRRETPSEPPVGRRLTGRIFGASKLRQRQGDALAGARLKRGLARTEVALIYADYATESLSGGQSVRRAPESGVKDNAPGDKWPLVGLRLDPRRPVSRLTFQLIASASSGPVPIWSETWDRRTARAKLRELGQYSHPRLKDEGGRPLKWTAAIPWSELVTVEYTRRAVDDPFPGRGNPFPDGALPAAYAPYKLFLTVNDGASDSGGHMMVAATFLNLAGSGTIVTDEEDEEGEVVDDGRDDGQQTVDELEQDEDLADDDQDTTDESDSADDDQDTAGEADDWSDWDWSEDDLTEIDQGEVIVERNDATRSLCLQLAGMAGVAYTLDDGILDPSDGVIDENDILIHGVSELSSGCVISFADDTPELELAFDAGEEDDQEDWLDGEDGQDEEWLEDDEADPVLSLVFAKARDIKYRLTFFRDDQVLSVVRGKLEAIEEMPDDGLLLQEIPRGATRSEILLRGQAEALELTW